jgi:deoxyadenosine/deoxycytidine kinase
MNDSSGYIIVEGNIGVGKSTFSQLLAEAFVNLGYMATYLPEPDEKTNPFLADYYDDPKANAYKMQMHLLHQRFKSTRYAQAAALAGKGWYVLDRSYYGDICFANVQRRLGYFSDDECASYLDAHRNMREFIEPPTCAIFLRAEATVCASRICKRGRSCESGVGEAYLRAIQDEIDCLQGILSSRCPVLSIDWNRELDQGELQAASMTVAKTILLTPRKDWSF